MRSVVRIAALAAALAVALPAAPAQAVPDCSPLPRARTVASGQGVLESVAADARGRLFLSDIGGDRVVRLDRPGGPPRTLAGAIDAPGGLVIDGEGRLVAGFGDTIANGTADNGRAGLLRIDPDTGERRLITLGLGMANGVARGPDGVLYASNDFGGDVDRIRRGRVEPDWAKVESSNGLAVDTTGRFLFVAQTFGTASVKRVQLDRPERVTTYASEPFVAPGPGLDGMARDGVDRLYVAANLAGEVWRIGRDRSICALLRGLPSASSVGFGAGGDFPARNLYAVAFNGDVVELVGATDRPPAPPALGRLRVRATPRRLPAGRRVAVTFTVTRPGVAGQRPAAGATVSFAGARVQADERGRAVVAHRFTRARLISARVSLRGLRGARLFLRVARPG